MAKNPEVERWLAAYNNPMKPVVIALRDLFHEADERIDECIKWQTPTFTYKGNLASFNPRSKAHASLLFHTGASIPGKHPRLEGSGGTARTMKIASLADAKAARAAIHAIVSSWIAHRDGGSSAGATRTAKAKPKAAKAVRSKPKAKSPKAKSPEAESPKVKRSPAAKPKAKAKASRPKPAPKPKRTAKTASSKRS